MARVKCITMHRDEDVLLEPWLKYCGYLFGFENIFVFDHGSVLPDVVATLQLFEQLGVEVRRDLTEPEDFVARGAHFANVIRHWDNSEDYDFVLPLDVSEFPAVFTSRGVSCARDEIHAALDALVERRFAFDLDIALCNVPGQPGWFWADPRKRRFLARGTVLEIDHARETMATVHGEQSTHTPLVYLDHGNRPLHRARAQARQKLDTLVDTDDADALRAYRGPWEDETSFFLLDEAGYMARFEQRPLVKIPEFSLLLRALGVDDPELADPEAVAAPAHALRLPDADAAEVTFDVANYLGAHPDLQPGAVLPLKHYLTFGHGEGRAIEGAGTPDERPPEIMAATPPAELADEAAAEDAANKVAAGDPVHEAAAGDPIHKVAARDGADECAAGKRPATVAAGDGPDKGAAGDGIDPVPAAAAKRAPPRRRARGAAR